MRFSPGLSVRLSVAACCALSACTSGAARPDANLSADARLHVAEAADAAGDADLAISMYTAAAASDPSNVTTQLRCADALARNGKIDQARQILTDRLSTSRGQPDLIRARALIDLVAGQPADAIAGFNEVLAARPGDVRTLVDKAVALDLQKRHADAQVIYRQVLAATPDDSATRNNLAVSMMLEGRTREALDTLAPLSGVEAAQPRLKTNLGILYAATGDSQRSRELLGDRVSDSDLLALTRAMGSPGASGRSEP